MDQVDAQIRQFLSASAYAVVGASNDPEKYGAKVLAAYLRHGLRVFPVNPSRREVQGVPCFPSLSELPERVTSVSVITPPEVTEQVIEEAGRLGVRFAWMQPGAESPHAVARAHALGIETIADGSCLLVVAGFREDGP